jgi:hypothetical protein
LPVVELSTHRLPIGQAKAVADGDKVCAAVGKGRLDGDWLKLSRGCTVGIVEDEAKADDKALTDVVTT